VLLDLLPLIPSLAGGWAASAHLDPAAFAAAHRAVPAGALTEALGVERPDRAGAVISPNPTWRPSNSASLAEPG
jgi:hypothetical protein